MKKFLMISIAAASSLCAEEGMWPFNMIPVEKIENTYGVELDPAWIEHVQKSCLRISAGGSGSFISPYGLVMTNHHVGSSAVFNLSSKDNDLMDKGFYAQFIEKEPKCTDLYVDQLISIRDVTDVVNRSASDQTSPAEREQARLSIMAEIKKKAQEETGLQPEIVILYHGAKYHLYLYKRYNDVRLVMAPEKAIAFLGGDTDNFEYPRYALDMCFFRVYENGKPLQVKDYLQWSEAGPQGEEGLFVAGHPGKTDRLLTSDHLKFVKDDSLPLLLQSLETRSKALMEFAHQSMENNRIAGDTIAGIENSRKAFIGINEGFSEVPVIQNKEKSERELFASSQGKDEQPYLQLKTALDESKSFYPDYWVLEGRGSRYGQLYLWAKNLVRIAEEINKPNDKRLKEYTETDLPTMKEQVLSTKPIYSSLEKVLLTDSFKRMIRILGTEHEAVKVALAGKTPEERADELIDGTKLMDLQYRKDLYGNPKAVQSSSDPLILLAKALDPFARGYRKEYEDKFESIEKESYAQIAKILFDRFGETVYPDATFTLRLAMGRMKGYSQNEHQLTPMTTLGGAYEHAKAHAFKEPYNLPARWVAKQASLNKDVPMDFILTADIIGGNSGSPVINGKGEVVGLIFDGNIQSLIWDYEFDDTQGRAIAVHSQGITETLSSIYNADPLVQEIKQGSPPKQMRGLLGAISRLFPRKSFR